MSSTSERDPRKPAMKAWKACWLNVNRCYKSLRVNLWKVTKLLNQLFDDADFRADNGLRDDLAAADWIDSRLPELPIGFMELRTILAHYPDKAAWEGTKFSKLRESIKPVRGRKPAQAKLRKPDVGKIQRERDYFAARAKHLETQITREAETRSLATQKVDTNPLAAESADRASRPAATSPSAADYAARLTAMLEAGVDYENEELMGALQSLKTVLDSVFSMAGV